MDCLTVLDQIAEIVMTVNNALEKVERIVGGLAIALQALVRIWDLIAALFADDGPVWRVVNKIRNFIEGFIWNPEQQVTKETKQNFGAIQSEFKRAVKLHQC